MIATIVAALIAAWFFFGGVLLSVQSASPLIIFGVPRESSAAGRRSLDLSDVDLNTLGLSLLSLGPTAT